MYNVAGITLNGMYNYFETTEAPLFENINVFEGGEYYDQTIPPMDKDILIDTIMEDNGEFICYRQIPDRFKIMATHFFEKNESNFIKMWIALNMDFNPIFNYDRYEESEDINSYNSDMTKSGSESDQGDSTLTKSGAETHKIDNSTGNYKIKEKVAETETNFKNLSSDSNSVKYRGISADNIGNSQVTTAGSYVAESMETETAIPTKTELLQGTNPGETSYSGVGYEVDIYGKDVNTIADRKDKTEVDMEHKYNNVKDAHTGHDDLNHSAHMYGNIGVTTSTAMIKEILELYNFNLYNYISDLFRKELLFEIY